MQCTNRLGVGAGAVEQAAVTTLQIEYYKKVGL
jgi:hypothetical protein